MYLFGIVAQPIGVGAGVGAGVGRGVGAGVGTVSGSSASGMPSLSESTVPSWASGTLSPKKTVQFSKAKHNALRLVHPSH